jgi:hypothetical protein
MFARVSEIAAPVEERGYAPGGRPELASTERLLRDVEKLSARVCALDWGLDVNDPVGCVGCEP